MRRILGILLSLLIPAEAGADYWETVVERETLQSSYTLARFVDRSSNDVPALAVLSREGSNRSFYQLLYFSQGNFPGLNRALRFSDALNPPLFTVSSFDVADIDGDGVKDVVFRTNIPRSGVGVSETWGWSLDRGDSVGANDPVSVRVALDDDTLLPDYIPAAGPIVAADFDLDGRVEVVVKNPLKTIGDPEYRLYRIQRPPGPLSDPDAFEVQPVRNAAGDPVTFTETGELLTARLVDRDDKPDLLFYDGNYVWYRAFDASLPEFFELRSDLVTFSLPIIGNEGSRAITFGDLNGDGDDDVIGVGSDGVLRIAVHWGPGSYSTPLLGQSGVAVGQSYQAGVGIGDVDGDGRNDIVYPGASGGVYWLRNQGGMLFGPPLAVDPDLLHPTWVGAADTDGDGRAEVYASTFWFSPPFGDSLTRFRVYKLRPGSPPIEPAPNPSFEPAGAATNALSFAADGSLGVLLYESNRAFANPDDAFARNRLVYRERRPDGTWNSDQIVLDFPENPFESVVEDAGFHFDVGSNPLVFALQSGEISLFASDGLAFELIESSSPPSAIADPDLLFLTDLVSARGPDGSVHFLVTNREFGGGGSILHAVRSPVGSWTWESLPLPAGPLSEFNDADSFEWVEVNHLTRPRCFSIAVDPDGHVHAVYSYNRFKQAISGGTNIRSSLFYATNASGTWEAQTLLSPGSGYGDYGGLGASIAAAPDGNVAVVAAIIPRPATGSAGTVSLQFLRRTSAGSWLTETISASSANYFGTTGDRGTGLNPLLTFDEESRPHVVFTDHATDAGTALGTRSYSGQVRYATRASAVSGSWDLRKIVTGFPNAARDFQVYEPALATGPNSRIAAAAVSYTWNEAEFKYVKQFHLLDAMTNVVDPVTNVPEVAPEFDKAKLAGNGKSLKLTGENLDNIKKLKVAGAKVESFKVRGGKRLIIKFAKPPKRAKMTIRIVTDDNKRLTFRVKS